MSLRRRRLRTLWRVLLSLGARSSETCMVTKPSWTSSIGDMGLDPEVSDRGGVKGYSTSESVSSWQGGRSATRHALI